jgi:hypothetical protein
MSGRIWRAFVAALVLATAPHAATAAPTPAPAASAAVTLPFNPPVNTPLRYDFEMRSLAGGVPRQVMRTVDELTYTRAEGGGYVLRWTSGSLRVEAPGPMQAVLEKTYAAMMGTPVLIAVNSAGAPERILNAAEVRTVAETALNTLVQSLDTQFATMPAEARTTVNKMMTALVDQQRQQSDAAFEESLMEGPRMMLPAPGPLVPGQPVSAEVQQPSPLGGGNIGFLAQIVLRAYKPGVSAEIVASSIANPEDTRRAMAGFVATMLSSIPDTAKRKQAEAELANMGPMSVSDEAVITLALPSGLTEQMQYQKQVTIPGQAPRLDTRSYVRIR